MLMIGWVRTPPKTSFCCSIFVLSRSRPTRKPRASATTNRSWKVHSMAFTGHLPEHGLDLGDHHIDGHLVFRTPWNNDVGPHFARLDKFHVHRFDCAHILLHDGLHGAA